MSRVVKKNENRRFLVKAVTGCMYYINIRSKWLSSNIYVVLSVGNPHHTIQADPRLSKVQASGRTAAPPREAKITIAADIGTRNPATTNDYQ